MKSSWKIYFPDISNIFLLVCLFEALIFVFFVCSFSEAQTIRLKEEVVVSSPEVKLADVVEADPSEYTEILNQVILCPAPKPGYAVEIPAHMILARLKNAGIDESTANMPLDKKAVVKRATVVLSKEVLADSLHHYILENMPWDKESTDIKVYPPADDIVLPEGDVEINWSPSSSPGFVGTGVYRGKVSVGGKLCKTIICRAKIEAKTLAISASHTIQRGKVINDKDITYKEVLIGRNTDNLLWDAESVVGSVARKTIPAGSFVKACDIELPAVIKKGEVVNLEYSSGSLTVIGKVKALSDAKVGERIRCVHLDSNTEVEGIVLPNGSIKVE